MRCRAWVSSYVDGINVQKEALTKWNRRILGQCREEVLSVRKTKGEGWLREREAGENLRFFFFFLSSGYPRVFGGWRGEEETSEISE